jgi:hypothetical protein
VRLTPGARFGGLVVVADDGHGAETTVRCDCGTVKVTLRHSLRSGRSTSCGCRQGFRRLQTHGLSRHPLYQTWNGMLRRCEDPANVNYRLYGARGITVCPEWHDVAVFIADIERLLGPRPIRATLDRIDPDGPYAPGKVRWASPVQQRANQRRAA